MQDSKQLKEALFAQINALATEFWEKNIGARFGQIQTLRDLNLERKQYGDTNFGYLPCSVDNDTRFMVQEATIESAGNTNQIRCTLWVAPITKAGVPSQRSIRLLEFWN